MQNRLQLALQQCAQLINRRVQRSGQLGVCGARNLGVHLCGGRLYPYNLRASSLLEGAHDFRWHACVAQRSSLACGAFGMFLGGKEMRRGEQRPPLSPRRAKVRLTEVRVGDLVAGLEIDDGAQPERAPIAGEGERSCGETRVVEHRASGVHANTNRVRVRQVVEHHVRVGPQREEQRGKVIVRAEQAVVEQRRVREHGGTQSARNTNPCLAVVGQQRSAV
mmetsp:Transcript_39492/g.92303  ORF Transcript_39492/g.92303 Transcript_39492/m.92303 type:complete len:221 (-) Transcript_39492:120-782(-)